MAGSRLQYRLLRVAFVFIAPLLLTAGLLTVATAMMRETRTVGLIAITADTFTDLGGGLTQAQGNVRLGNALYMTGAGDAVVFDSSTVTGTGSMALDVGNELLPLFSGAFHAAGADGLAIPGAGITSALTQVAGFAASVPPTITQISIPSALVIGTAGLRLTPPGVDTVAQADFRLSPGPTWAGRMDHFELATAGVTLTVPAGALLANGSIVAPVVTLILPAFLGGGAAPVNGLRIQPNSLELGGGALDFSLPDLLFGNGAQLKLSNNRGTLVFSGDTGDYRLSITSRLALNLPENNLTTPMTVTLARVNGQSQLSGALGKLSLNVAGTTLKMTQLTIGNSGLFVAQASLVMPQSLGGGQAMVYGIRITKDGLSIASGGGVFPIPTINIGDGHEVSFQRGQAALTVEGGVYRLDVSANLVLTLPENPTKTIPIDFHLRGGQITGTVGAVDLSVAGCTLKMSQISISNSGLYVANAKLRAPVLLGHMDAEVGPVTIGDHGLKIDRVTLKIKVAWGLLAFASLDAEDVTLGVLSDGSGYGFHAKGHLGITAPTFFYFTDIEFDLSYSPQGNGFHLSAYLSHIYGWRIPISSGLPIPIDMLDLLIDEKSLRAGHATLHLPKGWGGGTIDLGGVALTKHGLEINGSVTGTFDLPPITVITNTLSIKDAHAAFRLITNTFDLSAQGSLVITLPENSQIIPVSFKLDSHGDLTGTIDAMTINMASTRLQMTHVRLGTNGLAATNVKLQLPAGLGGETINLDDVRITSAGLTIGSGDAYIPLPGFDIGEHIAFRESAATLSIINTGGDEQYLLTVSSQLYVILPDNNWRRPVAFTLRHTAGGHHLSGSGNDLVLSVGGLTMTMHSFAIANDGLYMNSAELDLPPGLGGKVITLANVSITRDAGLDIGDVPLPDIEFGGGGASQVAGQGRPMGLAKLMAHDLQADPSRTAGAAPLALRHNHARVHVESGHLVLRVSSTLELSLPGNSASTQFSFQISKDGSSYQLSGALDQLVLRIAGCTLILYKPSLDKTGLHIGSATLSLPPGLGGSAPVDDWHITGDGLSPGADNSFPLPPVTFGGDGAQIQVANANANLAKDASGRYVFIGSGTLSLRLPDANSLDTTLNFTIHADGVFEAELAHLSLSVAGASLSAQDIDISNAGLHATNATFSLPPSLGSESVTLRNIYITKNGLSFGDDVFPLATIRFGDTVVIHDIMAELTVEGDNFTLIAAGTISLSLYYDVLESYAVSFTLDSEIGFVGVLDQMQLSIAGCALTITHAVLDNDGFAVDAAMLQLPTQLGATRGVVNNVRFTFDDGKLSIGGGRFRLPDILIGDGSKIRINNPVASIVEEADGYAFGIAGTLQLRLPQNSLDVALAAQIDAAGNLSGTVNQLALRTASLALTLNQVSLSHTGLAVAHGNLDLTSLGGRADFQVNDIRIDKDGLHMGGSGLTFAINEHIRLGGSSGFSVLVQQGTLGIAVDRTYLLTMTGTIELDVPGNSGVRTSGVIVVDSHGHFGGHAQAFALSVAGLSMQLDSPIISSDTLKLASARLAAPPEWGGEQVEVDNVSISKRNGIQIGGGSFALPDIKAGGFIISAHGSLQPDGDGYMIAAGGKFGVPNLSRSGSCALAVDVKLQTRANATVLTLGPAGSEPGEEDESLRTAGPAARHTLKPNRPSALYLRQAHLLLGCAIPIGATGFSLTRVEGSVTLEQGTTSVQVGASIASDLRVGVPALRGDVDLSMSTNPAEFGLAGSLYVFVFHASQLDATIKEGDGFRGTLWIEAVVARGNFTIHAWSANDHFHLTGSAIVEVGIPKGKIFSWSLPYPCCACVWYDCYKTSCWNLCYNGLTVPPEDLLLGNVGAQFGEFSISSGGTAYGFKGTVSVMGYSAGFYVDNNGDLTIGNVDQYQLVDSQQVAEARRLWREAARGASLPAPGAAGLAFVDDNTAVVNVPVTTTTDLIFVLSGSGNPPAVSLVAPDGTAITPDHLPANVQYRQTFARETAIPWQAAGVAQDPPTSCAPGASAPRLTGDIRAASSSASEVRVFNAAPDVLAADGSRAIDVLVNDVKLFSHVPYTDAHYVAMEPGAYTLQVLPADLAGPALVTTTLSVVTGTDYSVIVLGRQPDVAAIKLTDASAPVLTGTAQVRLVHAAPDTAALDLALGSGSVLTGSVAFKEASGYVSMAAGVHDLELRTAGALTTVVRLPGARLSDGSSYTVLVAGLAGGNPPLVAVLAPDVHTYPVTQTMYVVQRAQAGAWQVQLTGGTGLNDQYALSVLGSNPPPTVTAVSVVKTSTETAQVSWQLISGEADTAVDIYVTPGPITHTQVITQSNGATTTLVLPLYTGVAAAKNLAAPRDPTWRNGTPHTCTLDLGELESGTYWVWLKVEDMRNPPVQVYAPAPISVLHDAPGNWEAGLTATPGYGQLDVRWRPHPHPDVDGYVLYVGAAPLSPTRAIHLGDVTTAHLPALYPGRTYYLSLGAVDHAAGREARSQEIAATAGVADFGLTTSAPALHIIGGHASPVVVTLTTALDPYPATVGLYAGCIQPAAPRLRTIYLPLVLKGGGGERMTVSGEQVPARFAVATLESGDSSPCEIIDGIDVLFPAGHKVQPAPAGAPVTVLISTTHSLPGGEYRVPLVAYGGGVTRTLDLLVNVREPRFILTTPLGASILTRGASDTLVVSADSLHAESDPIHLDLPNAPPGLSWSFSDEVLYPGASVTLTLTDTHMLNHGIYSVHVRGEDGENTEFLPVALTVLKPSFSLAAEKPRSQVRVGGLAAVALDVDAQDGWTAPVTLTIDAQSVPAQAFVGFLGQPGWTGWGTSGGTAIVPVELVVTPPGRAFLAMATTANTPAGLYRIRVHGVGASPHGVLQRSVIILVKVYEESVQYPTYLPLIRK